MVVTWCSPEPVLFTCSPSARMPKLSSTARTKTTLEWPREKKNPTLIGRFPSAMSFRVVLSMAAMWSASKAWRMPRVSARMPVPIPNTSVRDNW